MRRLILAALLFSAPAVAEMPHDEAVIYAASCVATSAIVGHETPGYAGERISQEAAEWAAILIALTDEGFADSLSQRLAERLRVRFNSGEVTWREVVEYSKRCWQRRERFVREVF